MKTFRRFVLRGRQGAGAVELVLAVAFVIIPVSLLLLSLPMLVEYRSIGDAAAREAVRACAVASDPWSGQRNAERIARQILAERGRKLTPEGLNLEVDCSVSWEPGGRVTASVTFEVPATRIVGIGDLGKVTINRSYTEQMELHRSVP